MNTNPYYVITNFNISATFSTEVSDLEVGREKRSRPADFVDPSDDINKLLALEEENDETLLERAFEEFRR